MGGLVGEDVFSTLLDGFTVGIRVVGDVVGGDEFFLASLAALAIMSASHPRFLAVLLASISGIVLVVEDDTIVGIWPSKAQATRKKHAFKCIMIRREDFDGSRVDLTIYVKCCLKDKQ